MKTSNSSCKENPIINNFEIVKEMLDDMHRRKIDMADEIFVVNPGGYIGESTKCEIEYAKKTGKKVNYLVCEG